jgi:hypothetical protein
MPFQESRELPASCQKLERGEAVAPGPIPWPQPLPLGTYPGRPITAGLHQTDHERSWEVPTSSLWLNSCTTVLGIRQSKMGMVKNQNKRRRGQENLQRRPSRHLWFFPARKVSKQSLSIPAPYHLPYPLNTTVACSFPHRRGSAQDHLCILYFA